MPVKLPENIDITKPLKLKLNVFGSEITVNFDTELFLALQSFIASRENASPADVVAFKNVLKKKITPPSIVENPIAFQVILMALGEVLNEVLKKTEKLEVVVET